ncbi:MAG: serine hydrolase, partial [Bacteroidota bacterium]
GNRDRHVPWFLIPEEDKLKTVQRLKYLKPEGEVLNSWHYSNMGYTLAGTIIEQVTNNSWRSNIASKIFRPLHMNHSFTSLSEMQATKDYSIGYGLSNGKTEAVLYENFYSYSPASGIKSTALDLGNWMSMWLNDGQFNEQQVLSIDYVKYTTSMHNIRPQEGADKDVYLFGDGLGWRVESFNGHFKVHHGGNTSGFSTHLVMFPNEKIGIVVLANQNNSLLPYMVSHLISTRMLNLPSVKLEAYPTVVGEIYKADPRHQKIDFENPPSHSIAKFAGKYTAKGYGKIEIRYEEKQLLAHFPTFKFQLEHSNFNTFFMKGIEAIPQIMNPEFNLQFVVDINGDINGDISGLKLYSQKEPIFFTKKRT